MKPYQHAIPTVVRVAGMPRADAPVEPQGCLGIARGLALSAVLWTLACVAWRLMHG